MPNINFNIICSKSNNANKANFDISKKEIYVPKDGEVLKIINNTNELYGVTNYGRIISLKYNIVLKSRVNRDGYLYNCIRINKQNKYIKPHRLVAEYFINNPNNYSKVNHKDENKQNNVYTNLEWCNTKYNNSYGNRLNKCSQILGLKIDIYKIESDNAITFIETAPSINYIVKKYGISYTTIKSFISNYKMRWRTKNTKYIFKYHNFNFIYNDTKQKL